MSENSTKRTPGPWITSPHNRVGVFDSQKRCIAVTYNGVSVHDIGLGEQEANAAFIVHACNSHAALVAALEAIKAKCAAPALEHDQRDAVHFAYRTADAAIALARGAKP